SKSMVSLRLTMKLAVMGVGCLAAAATASFQGVHAGRRCLGARTRTGARIASHDGPRCAVRHIPEAADRRWQLAARATVVLDAQWYEWSLLPEPRARAEFRDDSPPWQR